MKLETQHSQTLNNVRKPSRKKTVQTNLKWKQLERVDLPEPHDSENPTDEY